MSNTNQVGKPSILVMMASYNGEKYIAEQIESILAQEGVDVTLHICDDKSIDSTPSICETYAERYGNVHFEVNAVNKGLAKNFMDMIYDDQAEGYDYYAFSDQDDVWSPEKLITSINAIRLKVAKGTPALYYSDVENVGPNLSGGSREFASWSSCSEELVALLVINWASGCTMVFNPELRSKLLIYKPSSYPRNHDGWIHLVSMVSGAVVADLDNSYIKRRISGENQVGERDLESTESFGAVVKRWRRVFGNSAHSQTLVAESLLNGYARLMHKEDLELIKAYAAMPSSILARIKIAMRLAKCPFPTKSMALSMAFRTILNRM